MSAAMTETLARAADLERAGRMTEAEASYRDLIGNDPGHAIARFNFACFLRRRGRLDEALAEHQAALELGIDRPEEVLSNMAVIQAELHRDAAARLLLDRALAINPNYVPAMYNLALQLEEQGERQAALELFWRILDLDPAYHHALVRVAHAETVREADGIVVRRLRRALRKSNVDVLTRESLHFALGKALDDCGRFEEAFAQYAEGNRLSLARLLPYDRAREEARVVRIIQDFGRDTLASIEPATERPLVFITGMFRSGSTLIEQVLAAHPRVTAGGEIAYFAQAPLAAESAEWAAIGRGYVEWLDRTFPGADVVTNKRPDAFALLGILRALFPNARFIDSVREARDNCLSIWFEQLDGRVGYAARLSDIAHHWRQYRRLMEHWQSLFGESILAADYDAYVADPRPATERLLGFLGLEWHEGCLEFQSASNRVRTASVAQVREPLYRRSSGRWRNYERWLGELADLPSASSTTTS